DEPQGRAMKSSESDKLKSNLGGGRLTSGEPVAGKLVRRGWGGGGGNELCFWGSEKIKQCDTLCSSSPRTGRSRRLPISAGKNCRFQWCCCWMSAARARG